MAIIGAYRKRTRGLTEAGASLAYRRGPLGWSIDPAIIAAEDSDVSDWLGFAVALDGNTALSGAAADDVFGNVDQGSAYVHTMDAPGTWIGQARLTADTLATDTLFNNGFE